MKFYNFLKMSYSNSFLCSFFRKFSPILEYGKNSSINNFLKGKDLVYESYLYKVYRAFFELLDRFLDFLRKKLEDVFGNSFLLGDINQYDNFYFVLDKISLFLLYSAVLALILGFKVGFKFPLLLFVIALFFRLFKGHFINAFTNSIIFNFFKDFFLLDGDENKWW